MWDEIQQQLYSTPQADALSLTPCFCSDKTQQDAKAIQNMSVVYMSQLELKTVADIVFRGLGALSQAYIILIFHDPGVIILTFPDSGAIILTFPDGGLVILTFLEFLGICCSS